MARNVSFKYTPNEEKVYSNTCLKMFQEIKLHTLESEFKEILDLIELFGQTADDKKLFKLDNKLKHYNSYYKPKIKEAKRLFVNTDKRLNYNMQRC